jgi:DNA-binding transcriptional ArsR family regulator
MPVTKWRPTKPEIRAKILRALADKKTEPELWGRKSWKDTWSEVKDTIKSRTTLSLYLQALVDEGHVIKEGEGRRTYYALMNTEYVERVLVGVSGGKVRRYGTVDLTKLNEEQFVRVVHNAMGMGLSVILHDYMLAGEEMKSGKEEQRAFEDLRPFFDSHYSNLSYILDFCSRVMARRIREGSFRLDRLWKAKQDFSRELEKESVKVSKTQDTKMEEGTAKITFAEVQGGRVRPAELGLRRIYGAILDSRKKGMLPPSPFVETSG